MVLTVEETVDEIFSLFEKHGDGDYIGEPVSKSKHMLLCAHLAEQEGASTEVILAALFHDIGHLIGDEQKQETMVTDGVILGAKNHEKLGAEFLSERGFPNSVTDPVLKHVQVKRYFVKRFQDYYDKLSDASKKTLVHQGGPMSDEEAAEFENSPNFQDVIRVRKWDELAKDPEMETPPVDKYKRMTVDYLKKLTENN